MDVTVIPLGYWVLRFDGEVLELLMADGVSIRIHWSHLIVEPYQAAVDQSVAPGGMSVWLYSARRKALWSQFDVPVAQVPAVQAVFTQIATLQTPPTPPT